MTVRLLLMAGVATALTWWLVGQLGVWAARRGWLDVPCARSAHVTPVPRIGGVAIALVAAAGLLAGHLAGTLPPVTPVLVGISLLVMGVGIADDYMGLPATPRLAAHFAAAAATVWMAGPIERLGVGAITIELGWLAMPLTVLWIAWFINAFNFMDGLDGMAGTQAVAAGTAWIGIGLLSGSMAPTWWGTLLVATGLGFLAHNWPPARVFMGDGGATALGYWLAVCPVVGGGQPWAATAGLLVLWPFVWDATFTLLQRVGKREVLAAGHQRHFYQRLARTGWTHQTVTLLYGTWSAGTAAVGLAAGRGAISTGTLLAAVVAGPLLIAALVGWRERTERPRWEAPIAVMKGRTRPSGKVS